MLVYQRYGRGLSVAFPIQDSWNWQMDPETPAEDQTFERFWRQMLRWLTTDVPNRVVIALPTDQVEPEEPDRDSRVGGRQHLPRAQRREGRRASDERQRLLARSPARLGDRSRRRVSRHVHARSAGHLHDSRRGVVPERRRRRATRRIVRVADLNTEYFDAEMRAPLLKRMADETGGRFYTPATASTLAEDVALSKRGVTVVNQMDLWDMPSCCSCCCRWCAAEWSYRKLRGLA